ncbi:MAG TPA: M1 family aminopeptidase [Candidatus Krumholzibacteria bacterium]|nr:M1 family aminopeptidase [Candidatus Krumholzibacteria bacterium]
MRRVCLTAALLLAAALPVWGADYFQQFHHTTIHCKLDAQRKWLSGSETIVYANNSPDTLKEFYLHLYPNAFRSKDSAYMRDEHRQYNLVLRDLSEEHKGWLKIENVKIDGTAVEPKIDDTIAQMTLPAPLAPGDTLHIQLTFDEKIHKAEDRSGYTGNHFDMAQWYPKIVVYDDKGFHPDKFMTGEFYGEFGTFDVHIELPENFVVAATGLVADGDPGWTYNPPHAGKNAPMKPATDKTKVVHFHAEQVHDFTWVADPTFVVQDTTIGDLKVYSVYRRKSAKTWEDSTLVHLTRAIAFEEKHVGKYQWPQITVCEMLRRGGMEYPMIILDGRANQFLVMHEFGHEYFYGQLANNEREEAWIDEGFASFITRWYDEQKYGPWGDKHDWNWYQRITPQYKLWEAYRRDVFDLDRRNYGERTSFRSEKYDNSYRIHVYQKAALTYNVMRFVAGDSTFDVINHTFFDKWKLKHVNEDRYREACESVLNRDLSRQFEQWLHTRKTVDYDLEDVRTKPDSTGVLARAIVRRIGELYCPIEVQFTMPDGSVVRHRMDARNRSLVAKVHLPAAPVRTAINADNEIMDVNMTNNFLPRKKDFQIDWPNNTYFTEDAYTIRHRPAVWYNDVDGAKVGYHFYGSREGWWNRNRIGLYYGIESGRFDFSASRERPMFLFGNNATMSVSGYRMEGRNDARIQFEVIHRPKLIVPPTQTFTFGFGYHELRDPKYLVSTEIYDTTNADTGPYFAYTIEPQIDVASVHFGANLDFGRRWLGGDVRYERLATELWLKSRPDVVKLDWRLRGFAGFTGGGAPPQRKFNLAGGGAMAQEERFWLRSPGAVPEQLHYLEPGDGNLRGYAAGTFSTNKLVAINTEIGMKVPGRLAKFVAPLIGTASLYGFYDAGWILDTHNPIGSSARIESLVEQGVLQERLDDAGVGIRSDVKWPFWNFTWRFDVPFWVAHPEVNAETKQTDWRYIFSIVSTF